MEEIFRKIYEEIVTKFIEGCQNQFSGDFPIDKNSIINMDEIGIYLDSTSNYTYSSVESKRIPAITSGNEKTGLSIPQRVKNLRF